MFVLIARKVSITELFKTLLLVRLEETFHVTGFLQVADQIKNDFP
jgi:hypothetical protein